MNEEQEQEQEQEEDKELERPYYPAEIYRMRRESPSYHEGRVKILFVGEKGVGKTTLARRVAHNDFWKDSGVTTGIDCWDHVIKINEKAIHLEIWDSAGYSSPEHVPINYFRSIQACCILFDCTRRSTFHKLYKWISFVKNNMNENTLVYIIGTKVDSCDFDLDDMQTDFISEIMSLPMYEVSAKTGAYVGEIFSLIVTEIEEMYCTRDRGIKLEQEPREAQEVGRRREGWGCCGGGRECLTAPCRDTQDVETGEQVVPQPPKPEPDQPPKPESDQPPKPEPESEEPSESEYCIHGAEEFPARLREHLELDEGLERPAMVDGILEVPCSIVGRTSARVRFKFPNTVHTYEVASDSNSSSTTSNESINLPSKAFVEVHATPGPSNVGMDSSSIDLELSSFRSSETSGVSGAVVMADSPCTVGLTEVESLVTETALFPLREPSIESPQIIDMTYTSISKIALVPDPESQSSNFVEMQGTPSTSNVGIDSSSIDINGAGEFSARLSKDLQLDEGLERPAVIDDILEVQRSIVGRTSATEMFKIPNIAHTLVVPSDSSSSLTTSKEPLTLPLKTFVEMYGTLSTSNVGMNSSSIGIELSSFRSPENSDGLETVVVADSLCIVGNAEVESQVQETSLFPPGQPSIESPQIIDMTDTSISEFAPVSDPESHPPSTDPRI